MHPRFVALSEIFALILLVGGPLRAEPAPATPGPDGRRAFEELGKYYKDHNERPEWGRDFDQLSSKDKLRRQAAVLSLEAFLVQSVADEADCRAKQLDGADPMVDTPWMWRNGSWRSVASGFRAELVEAIPRLRHPYDALDLILWVIRNEPETHIQTALLQVINRLETTKLANLLPAILDPPHPNTLLLVRAIDLAGERHLKGMVAPIRSLCADYRSDVRAAARRASSTLGIKGIPKYVPAEAFSPSLVQQIRDCLAMPVAPVPPGASWYHFAKVDPSDLGPDGKPRVIREQDGWVLSESAQDYEVLSWFGLREIIPKKDILKTPRTMAQVVHELLDPDSKYNEARRPDFTMMNARPAGRGDNFEMVCPRGLLGVWCFARGDRDSAAKLIYSLFKSYDPASIRDDSRIFKPSAPLEDERWFIWAMRSDIAGRIDESMVEAFCRDWDSRKAIALADLVGRPAFKGYSGQERAKKLAVQLRASADDFKTVHLPTPVEWKALQAWLGREEQIRYLIARLHLLTGPRFAEDPESEFAEAPGEYRAHPNQVINPFTELIYLRLSVAELSLLLPSLHDHRYVRIWGGSAHALFSVSFVAAELFNAIAKREVVDVSSVGIAEEAFCQKQLEQISVWSRSRAGWSNAEMLLDAVRNDDAWSWVMYAAREGLDEKIDGIVPAILSRWRYAAGGGRTGYVSAVDPPSCEGIAELLYQVDAPEFPVLAREWLKDKSPEIRVYGALNLLRTGNRAENEGLAELKLVLGSKVNRWVQELAIATLIERGDAASMDAVLGVLVDEKAALGREGKGRVYGSDIANMLLRAGRQEIVDVLGKGLDSTEPVDNWTGTWNGEVATRHFVVGDEVAEGLADLRADRWKYDRMAPDADRAKRRAELKEWLNAQLVLVHAGKPPALKQVYRPPKRTWPVPYYGQIRNF